MKVKGKLIIQNGSIQITTGATTGYVLTTDGNGVGVWQPSGVVTGGTFNDVNDTITLFGNNGGSVSITGLTDNFVTGATFDDVTDALTLTRNDGTTIVATGLADKFITGGTNNTAVLYLPPPMNE